MVDFRVKKWFLTVFRWFLDPILGSFFGDMLNYGILLMPFYWLFLIVHFCARLSTLFYKSGTSGFWKISIGQKEGTLF